MNSLKEIDFIVNNDDDKYYIQVCFDMESEETLKREIEAFSGIDDGFKKIIITKSNNIFTRDTKGYIYLDIFEFLLNEKALEEA
jgi:predicted AAA+ superfamily ATPase